MDTQMNGQKRFYINIPLFEEDFEITNMSIEGVENIDFERLASLKAYIDLIKPNNVTWRYDVLEETLYAKEEAICNRIVSARFSNNDKKLTVIDENNRGLFENKQTYYEIEIRDNSLYCKSCELYQKFNNSNSIKHYKGISDFYEEANTWDNNSQLKRFRMKRYNIETDNCKFSDIIQTFNKNNEKVKTR